MMQLLNSLSGTVLLVSTAVAPVCKTMTAIVKTCLVCMADVLWHLVRMYNDLPRDVWCD